jgi:adenylate cyclase
MAKRIPYLLGFLLVAVAIWLQITSIDVVKTFILRLNNMSYDMQLRTKVLTQQATLNTSVAIIDIDDKSLKQEGRWPWPRYKLAELINRLHDEGVVVIAMDIMFSEQEVDITNTLLQELTKRKLNTPDFTKLLQTLQPELDNDSKFAKSLADKDIVLGMTFLPKVEESGLLPTTTFTLSTPAEQALGLIKARGYASNIPLLQSAAKNAGFINVFPDSDGIIRRVPMLMRYKDNVYSSLAFQAVQVFLLANPKLETNEYHHSLQLEGVQLGEHYIPTDALGQALIPFRGKSYTFPFYSATDVLHKKIPANALAGKIAILGTAAAGLGDIQATAVQGSFPGVEIQASLIDGILENNFSYKPEWTTGAEIVLTFMLGLIFAILFPFLGPRALSIFIVVVPASLIILNNWLWIKTGLIIFILVPSILTIVLAITNMVYGYLFETRKRKRLKGMFGQYVPEKHIDAMLKQSSTGFALHGENREMTVLFADIRNFTTISEPMSAAELKNMLNDFLTPMTEIIFKHQGTIDKYIGDLIMAFWGAPMEDANHARNAIAAALEMQVGIDKLKVIFAERNLPEINIGIGLNSGVMSVGDMGSKYRKNYTVLGDAVNLGSRVESLTKYYGVKIMVAENTQKDQPEFLFRILDRVRVKGKRNGIAIYEPIGHVKDLTDETKAEITQSDAALALYFNSQWVEAEQALLVLTEKYPDVKLYSLYLKRIEEFKLNPPPENWGGVYEHLSK